MTQLNWGRKEGKIRFFITIPEYVWTLLTQEPSPTKVSAQTVAVIESEQQQQQQQNPPYQLPSPLFTEAWLCNRNLHVGIQWLGANGEGGTHRHIQVDVLMCTPQKASKAHTRKGKNILYLRTSQPKRGVYLQLLVYMVAESPCVRVSPSQYTGKMHVL